MEQLGLAGILGIAAIIWYLGSSINAVLAGSGEIAEAEFNQFKKSQDLRIFKQRVKMHKQVSKLGDQAVYSDEEWQKIFHPDKED